MFKLLREFAVEEIFSYELLKARKEEKLSTDELHPRGVQDSPSSFFCPTSRSSQESEGFFLTTSYIQGQVRESQGSRWVRQGWSIATRQGREKVKKWKRPRKARRWLQRRQCSVCPQPRIPFFGSRVFGHRSGPSWLKYRLLRDLVYEEAMWEGSSGNGLLYAAKAVP